MSMDLEKMTQDAADNFTKAVEQYADACSKGEKDKLRGKSRHPGGAPSPASEEKQR